MSTEPLSKLDLILSTITDGVLVVNQQGIVLYANHAAELLLERGHLLGKSLAIPVNPGARRQEINLIRPSGVAWAEFFAVPIEWDGKPGYVLSMSDITQRKQAEISNRNLNRVNVVMARVNESIIHIREPDAMFREVCRIAVENGDFLMAWIGLPDTDAGELRPVAYAGVTGDYLDHLHISLRDDEHGRGPTGISWREDRQVVCSDIEHSSPMAPWRESALKLGFRASTSLPIRVHGAVHGTFTLYSDQANFFSKDECSLLQEMVDNIGFALEVAETEAARVLAVQSLQKSELLFHTLASSAPVGIFRADTQGLYEYVNECWYKITGITPDAALGHGWTQAVFIEDQTLVITAWNTAVKMNALFHLEYRFQRPDGEIAWVIGQADIERDASGAVLGFVGTITDITTLKANEEYLHQAASIFESAHEGVMLTDMNMRILKVNPAFTDITLYTEAEVLGNTPTLLRSGRHDREFYAAMWSSIIETDHWQGEIWNRRKNGEIYPELLSISVIKGKTGEIINYVGMFADISKLKESESKLEFLAHHDALTGLPNRLMLVPRMEHALALALRDNKLLALLMIDLDRFKDVNDSYGHLIGDELLQQVGDRLISHLRDTDTVCRLGGDEFTILLEDVSQPGDAARIANDIITSLSKPWLLSNGSEVRIGASIGISLYPTHSNNAETLLQQADTALYQAKNEGRGRFKYFSEDLTRAARARIELEVRLRRAIDQGELRVFYQPQVNVDTGRIIGAEVLVRWQDPERGLISPIEFIPLAEDTGLITPISNWILKETCSQGQRWIETGLPPLVLAVNLSPHQFLRSDISDVVQSTLAETGFPADRLELELTESALMQHEDEAIETLNRLHALGIHLAIDDFGTGYSSLAYLKLFPLDVLKIDKRFIDDIPHHRDDMEITAAIIGMAHTLRLKVLAEGVETKEQLAFLKMHGCNLYQGYLFSPAVPAEAFEKLLAAQI